MGQAREHPGHGAAARQRIAEAREHYETRKERRKPKEQAWQLGQTKPAGGVAVEEESA
jgi:hypothetical protein